MITFFALDFGAPLLSGPSVVLVDREALNLQGRRGAPVDRDVGDDSAQEHTGRREECGLAERQVPMGHIL
jgi:hypothetical protein